LTAVGLAQQVEPKGVENRDTHWWEKSTHQAKLGSFEQQTQTPRLGSRAAESQLGLELELERWKKDCPAVVLEPIEWTEQTHEVLLLEHHL